MSLADRTAVPDDVLAYCKAFKLVLTYGRRDPDSRAWLTSAAWWARLEGGDRDTTIGIGSDAVGAMRNAVEEHARAERALFHRTQRQVRKRRVVALPEA